MRLSYAEYLQRLASDVIEGTHLGLDHALFRFVRSRRQPNAVFIWIPKNAGTSVVRSLQRHGATKLTKRSHVKRWFRQRGVVTFGHMDYKLLLENNMVSQAYDRSAFKFCLCRNPYDRAISLYQYLKNNGAINDRISFEQLLESLLESPPPAIGLFNVNGLSQCNPQYTWIKDIKIDFVCKVEEIDLLGERLKHEIGLDAGELSWLNATGASRNRSRYLNSVTIPMIERLYQVDFEQFNYEHIRQ